MRNKLFAVALSGSLFLGLSFNMVAVAALKNSAKIPSGIAISPIEQNIALSSNVAAQQATITLTNHTNTTESLDLSAQDFGPLNNTGAVLLESPKSNYGQQYGLVSWLDLGTNTVTLRPGETQNVPVNIENREDLTPGGHYAAIIATVDNGPNQASDTVAVNQRLLSLLLVDKVGGDHYNLSLQGIAQNGNWLHLPNTVNLNFQNPGNVQVVPRGIVKLKSPSGNVIATGIINTESGYVLPDSFRTMYVSLDTIGHAVPLPGLYHVEVDYRYDGITQYAVQSQVVQFIDIGLYMLVVGLTVLAVWVTKKRYRGSLRRVIKQPDETNN
jgi:hypothetical protein